ncbi:MAG: O-antigen ligase family protein [Deltaproteobacteria bacterium]|nr:O-antigen ligase family protein [Deltaproteobacteria bacterium]
MIDANAYAERARGYALIAYAAFLPFSITGAQTALALLLVFWARDLATKRAHLGGLMSIVLSAFLAWTFLAAIFAVDRPMAFSRLPNFWIHLAWFPLIVAMENRRALRRSLWALAVSAALIGLYGLAQARFGPAVPRFLVPDVRLWQPSGGYYHAVGLFDHHLTYGNTLMLCLAGALALGGTVTGRARWFVATCGAAIVGGLFVSYARSAWLGTALMVAVFALFIGRRASILAAVAGAIVLSAALAASPTIRDRFFSSFRPGSNTERVYLWTTSWNMALDHPITGIGPGVYRSLAPKYREGIDIHWTTASHAHNSYIMAAAESGFPAMMFFVAILVAAFRGSGRLFERPPPGGKARWWAAAWSAGVAGFALAAFFNIISATRRSP